MMGVYSLYCLDSNRQYIGSSIDMRHRLLEHYTKLELNQHINSWLQEDFNRYGRSRFMPEFIEEVFDSRDLLKREYWWINQTKDLYNRHKYYKKMPKLTEDEIKKFWSNVDKTNECWLWTKDIKKGYPRFWISRLKLSVFVHRLSYSIEYGQYDPEIIICHKCDNKRCVRPDHLFLGSHQDNQLDRTSKGIGCKLSADLANKIRQDYLNNNSKHSKDLVKLVKDKYNIDITPQSLNMVLTNKTHTDKDWKITSRIDDKDSEYFSRENMSWEIVEKIRTLCDDNIELTYQQLIDLIYDVVEVKLTKQHLNDILLNKKWFSLNYKTKYIRKQKQQIGASNSAASLTVEQVRWLRELYKTGKYKISQLIKELERVHGIKYTNMYALVKNKIYIE